MQFQETEYLSISVAVVLIILHALYLIFYLSRQDSTPGTGEEEPPFGRTASFSSNEDPLERLLDHL